MTDPRQDALADIHRLMQRGQKRNLTAKDCTTLVHQLRLAPGMLKQVAYCLSDQQSACGVDALLQLPSTVPGVIEGLYRAFSHGIVRLRLDGSSCVPMLALDFRRSRAKTFDQLLTRAQTVFTEHFEALSIYGQLHYRVGLQGGRGTLAGRASAISHDLQWLHGRLSKLKGTRLWINGWSFASDGPFRAPVQVHLVQAWLTWAATQTQTQRDP